MNQQDIENAILLNLYEDHFLANGYLNLKELRNKEGWDDNTFNKVVHRLRHENFIFSKAISTYSITPTGIFYCEELGIAPKELSAQNKKARILILDSLNDVYEEEGPDEYIHFEVLSEKTGIATDLMMSNLLLLADLNCADSSHTVGFYKITDRGISDIKDWVNRKFIGKEFEDISKMTPQMRGRAFQKFFAKIIERFGWMQDEGVRTSHEEMDILVYRGREYYLVECKWGKDPIEAGVIRELHGKLSNRVDVRGIVVSMSGFTEGALTQVKEYVSSRVVLLFGSKDVDSMVYENHAFDDLLNQKYKELITRRNVVFN